MSVNDFLPFAADPSANVESQTAYIGSGHQISGFTTGMAQSPELNKVWRQSSIIAHVIAQLISDKLGIDVLDDGNIATLLANLKLAMDFGSKFSDTNIQTNSPYLHCLLPAGTLKIGSIIDIVSMVRFQNTNVSIPGGTLQLQIDSTLITDSKPMGVIQNGFLFMRSHGVIDSISHLSASILAYIQDLGGTSSTDMGQQGYPGPFVDPGIDHTIQITPVGTMPANILFSTSPGCLLTVIVR